MTDIFDRRLRIRDDLEPVSRRLLDADADRLDNGLEWDDDHNRALQAATTAFGNQPTAHAYLRALLYGPHAGSIDHAVLNALGWSPEPGTPMLLRSGTPVAVVAWPSMLVADGAGQDRGVAVTRYDTTTGSLHHMEVARFALFVR